MDKAVKPKKVKEKKEKIIKEVVVKEPKPKIRNKNLPKIDMTPQEVQEWDDLYMYIKYEVLEYGDKKNIPPWMVLRLKGLLEGKFMANKAQKPRASYSYKEVLMTFKLCKGSISKYMMGMNGAFSNEHHLFNGIMVIVEGNINDTVDMLERAKKAEGKAEVLDLSHQTTEDAGYTPKGKVDKSKMKDLW